MEEIVKDITLRFNDVILEPILWILVSASVIMFLWGLLIFLVNGNDGDRSNGKSHMLWGLIGLFIVFSTWGFVNLIQSTLSSVA